MTFDFWLFKHDFWLYKVGNAFSIARRDSATPLFTLDVSGILCSDPLEYFDYLDSIGMVARYEADFGFTLLEAFDNAEALWDLIECTKARDEVMA